MLPKIQVPKYSTILPISKKTISYRPFTVKEEKILLLAKELKDQREILRSVLQVVDNCTFDQIDLNAQSVIDLEWMFIKLRSKSVGEVSEIVYSCLNQIQVDGTTRQCGSDINVSINLEDITLSGEIPDNKIELGNNIGIVLKYPNVDSLLVGANVTKADEFDTQVKMVFELVDYVYDANEVHPKADMNLQEFEEWIESLQSEQFAKIENFFKSFPTLSKTVHLKCPKCGSESDVDLKGLHDFF